MLVTIVGFLSVTGYADFGIGHGLQNIIPQVQEDSKQLQQVISSTLGMLVGVALVVAGLGTTAILLESEYGWLGIQSNVEGQSFERSFLAALACFSVAIPVGIVTRVQTGLQQSHVSNAWFIGGSVLSLLATVLGVYVEASAAQLILLIYGTQTLAQVGNFVQLFWIQRRDLRPSIAGYNSGRANQVLRIGLSFFLIHAAMAVLYALDNVILAKYVGYAGVTIFSIGLRLINLYTSPVIALATPILPALNDAIVKDEIDWARNKVGQFAKVTLIGSLLAALIFVATTNPVLSVWLGEDSRFSAAVLVAFAIYLVYSFVSNAASYVMMTEVLYRRFRIIFPIAVAATLIAKVWATAQFGLIGFLYSTVLAMAIVYIIPSIYAVHERLSPNSPVRE